MALENLTRELLYSYEDGVATLTFNRPDKMNAFTTTMIEGISKVADEVRKDDEVKVLVITGAGRGYCAGADMSYIVSLASDESRTKTRSELTEPLGYVTSVLYNLNKPVITAINGAAVGAGLSLALIGDIRIASDHANFGAFWIRMGLVPDFGASYFLPRIVGLGKALELTLTGELIDAREAERIGLVTRVVPREDLMKVTIELALKIARGPSIAIELTKRVMCKGINGNLDTQLDLESYAQNFCLKSNDLEEAITAFKEKRDPHFRGS